MTTYPDRPGALTRLIRALVFCATAFFIYQLASLYLSWPKQILLGSVTILLALAANRISTSRVATLALMLISITATIRYAWWRFHLLSDYFADESNRHLGIDTFFLLLLASAEAYTILIMVLGYMQTARPLRRMPIPLPVDDTLWPEVDILIPTYNEPLALVRYTALAANNMDYPPDKLHVHILDDGERGEFREFARAAGVNYITREEHSHAKAGNINHALTLLDSPYVAIFDCDHVPTRSFLQMTLGWMLADRRLAMLQTPHHFYSPDPFERNLLQYTTIPNEAELFYGIVQDGNDLWNATFFCGSCAVIRRSALDEVGGIATETVTEDAHTSLRLQKLGYNTAYINIPQAAGLATESLAAHVGQRIRWARGMIQILRTENPLFAWKMKLSQRLCYFNAMAHFLYAVPRLVFLLSPLVYLLLGRTIIPGYWVAILAYAFPHLVLSSLTNSRVQGRHRHSFWNEIYEAVLAPYILAPTLLAFINPKLGKFNVTDKGSTMSSAKYDSSISTPTRWLLLLNFVGLLAAPYRLLSADQPHAGAVIMNVAWVLFNMVILGVAAAVAYEQKQNRGSVRIEVKLPMRLHLPEGRFIDATSLNMSVGGASLLVADRHPFSTGDRFRVSFPEHAGERAIGATVIGVKGNEVRLSFQAPSIHEQETLTRALYSRADAWITPLNSKEMDRPLLSFARVVRLSGYGIYQILRSLFASRPAASQAGPVATVAVLAAALAMSACAQTAHASGRAPVAAIESSAAATASPAQTSSENTTVVAISLKDMGLLQTIELRGPHSYYSERFTLPYTMNPRQSSLKLVFGWSAGLDAHSANLKVSMNDTVIAKLTPNAAEGAPPGLSTVSIPVPDTLLVRNNTLTFECAGGGVLQREEQARAQVLVRISSATRLEVNGDKLLWQNGLGQLPLPIFDADMQTATTIPFVFLTEPTPKALQAAGVAASWLGILGSTKPVRFSVSIGQIPAGNAVVFSSERYVLPSSLQVPLGSGPLLAMRSNPSDPFSNILVLAGDDDDQLLTAARTLSLSRGATATTPAQGFVMSGDTVQVPEFAPPAVRRPGDAPRWMPASRAAPLASCRLQETLQTDGSSPIPIYLHLPPDLFYGEKQNVDMHVHYRYNAASVAKGSALRVKLNGVLVGEITLPPGTGTVEHERALLVPVADLRPFGNTLLFSFDFVRANPDAAQDTPAGALKGEILCSSSLDLQGLALWTQMPNLELFSNAGFPFTRIADLAETTVVLPSAPSVQEIALYLHLMSHFGAQTGYPVLQVTVAGPATVLGSGRDYLVLGTVSNQPALGSLDSLLPVTMDANGVHTKEAQGYSSYLTKGQNLTQGWWSRLTGAADVQNRLTAAEGLSDALVEEIQSPSSADRSIVVIALRADASEDVFTTTFLDRSQSGDITGSASLLRGLRFESYTPDGTSYHVGDISRYEMMRIELTQFFLPLLLLVTALSFLVALWMRESLEWRAADRLKLASQFDPAALAKETETEQ